RAATILVEQLDRERNREVQYKVLRALGRLHTNHPAVQLSQPRVERATERMVRQAFLLLAWRTRLEAAEAATPSRATPAGTRLIRLLADQEAAAIERVFRLIDLRDSREDVASMFRGLKSHDPAVRSSSRELLDHMLSAGLRDA